MLGIFFGLEEVCRPLHFNPLFQPFLFLLNTTDLTFHRH
jgi:hypothetical protein